MKLSEYFRDKPRGSKTRLAEKLNRSLSYLIRIEKGSLKCPIPIAKKIETLTNGVVTKADLRPDVWEDNDL